MLDKAAIRAIADDIEDCIAAMRRTAFEVFIADAFEQHIEAGASEEEAREAATSMGALFIGYSLEAQDKRLAEAEALGVEATMADA
jgi:hypothetical protein